MSESTPSSIPYRVETSGLVDRELEDLEDRAFVTGFRQQFLDALDQIYRILRIYPQFGEPLRDLTIEGETVYLACVLSIPPLYVEYIIDEPNRRVFIVVPFKVLPNSGFK